MPRQCLTATGAEHRGDAVKRAIRAEADSYDPKDEDAWKAALEILKLSTQRHPVSTRGCRLLADEYEAVRNTAHAIQNYEKSLPLNPKNDLSKAALANLRGGKSP